MSNLGPQAQNQSYPSLLQIPGGITSTLQTVTDGEGNPTALSISTTAVSGLSVTSNIATNLANGSAGQIPYQTNADTTSFISNGTSGQYLKSNGSSAPSFATITANNVGALPLTGGALSGALSLGNNKITSLATPTLSTDAATKAYVDSVSGGNLVYNVTDYGAIGNGIANDTTAIQNTIDAAQAAGGGTIYFPAGKYRIAGSLNAVGDPSNQLLWGVHFAGEGPYASEIIQANLNSAIIVFDTIGSCSVDNLSFNYDGTPTGGEAIYITGQSGYINLTRFIIRKAYVGVYVYGPTVFLANIQVHLDNFWMFDCISSSLYVNNSVDVFASNFTMTCPAGSSYAQNGHIRLANQTQAITLVNGDIILGNYSMTTEASVYSSGYIPERNNITNIFFDSSVNGVYLNKAQEFDFVNCWFASTTSAAGVTLAQTQSMRFTNCKFYNCGYEGAKVTTNSTYVSFTACDFQSNSAASAGAYAGVQFDGGCQNFQVLGCMGNCLLFTGPTPYARQFAALGIGPTCDNFIVSNNLFTGIGGGITNGSGTSATKIVSNNLT